MKKYYFIVPAVLLAIFLGYERHFQRQREILEHAKAESIAAERAQKEEEREKQVALARSDTEKRTADREKQEKEKADQKKRDYETLISTLQSQADQQAAEAKKISDTIHELAVQVDAAREKQQAIEHAARELTRQIELKQADLRKAEIDIQHTTGAVAARLGASL